MVVELNKVQAYNKGLAAAAVTVVAWVAGLLGLEIPAEVQGALITIAVVLIPNR